MPFIGMLVFLMLFCGGLIYVMYRILGHQAHHATERFQSLSEDFEKKSAEIKKRTKEAESAAQKLIADAEREAEKIKSQASADAQKNNAKTIEDARSEADRVVKDALKTREALRQELAEQMHGKMIEAARQLVLKILPLKLRQDVHAYWFDELLEHGLQALDQFRSHEEIKTAEVVSAFPLDDAHRDKILKCIEKKLNTSIQLKEKVEPELVSGLRITLGHLVLEGSLISRLKEAVQDAQNDK